MTGESAAGTSATGPAAGRPVTVVGDIAVDVVARHDSAPRPGSDTPATIRFRGGGAGANVATWLARLGVDCTLVGRVGADPAGQQQLRALTAAGVRCAVATDPQLPTGVIVVLAGPDRDRTMLADRGANLRLHPDDLPELPAGGHLHLSGYPLLDAGSRAAGLAALERARHAGATVSVDPASAGPLAEVGAGRFLEWTAGAELILPNLTEARLLSGHHDPVDAARWLARHYGAAVVSLGADGAVWASGAAAVRVPALAVAEVVDTTGAGDALTAAVLAGWVDGRRGRTLLEGGVAVAARAVVGLGARPPDPHG